MKVKELKDIVNEWDDSNDDFDVVVSSDSEGNNFSPLAEIGVGHYMPENTWSGELVEENEDYPANAVVLWPVN